MLELRRAPSYLANGPVLAWIHASPLDVGNAVLYCRGMDKTSKPFAAGAAVLDSYGRAGIVARQNWHRDYGWRAHYYTTENGAVTGRWRDLASNLRPCPYCARDEACAYHVQANKEGDKT